jgi:hypothetical protein
VRDDMADSSKHKIMSLVTVNCGDAHASGSN